MQMNYYIADLHLGDQRVFDLCRRNISIEDYNQKLISNWNAKVKDDDHVWIIGDFCKFDYLANALEVLHQLNGHHHLVFGNHDEEMLEIYGFEGFYENFDSVYQLTLIDDNNREVFLCHYPMLDWWNSQYGSYHIYGHIHNKDLPEIKAYYKDKLAFNASADVIDHTPMTLDELIKLKEMM